MAIMKIRAAYLRVGDNMLVNISGNTHPILSAPTFLTIKDISVKEGKRDIGVDHNDFTHYVSLSIWEWCLIDRE